MVGLTLTFVVIYLKLTTSSTRDAMKYLIPNLFIGLFAVLYLIKFKFSLKVVERVFMFIQDAIIITILNIFVHNYQYIA